MISAMDKKYLHKARCESCSVKTDKKVYAYGSNNPDVVIIGEAPGRREEAKGTPFIGRSGELLWNFLNEVGISEHKIATTNLLLCRPPDNRTPTNSEIGNCSKRLEAFITETNPDYILTVGATSSKYFLNTERGIKDIRGRVYWDNHLSSYILPTIHPAACLRARMLARDLLNDIQKLHRCLEGWKPPKIQIDQTEIPNELQTNYSLITDTDKAIEALDWLYQTQDLLSFDLETSGFDFKNDYILCMGVAYDKKKALIFGESLFNDRSFLNYLSRWFDRSPDLYNTNPKILWQNGKFDLKFMRETAGIKNTRVDRDNMLEHYLLDERKGEKSKDGREEGRGVHDLQYLSGFYLNAPEYENAFKQYVDDSYADAPRDKLHQYCAYDVDFTRRIHKDHLIPKMGNDLKDVNEKLMIPGTNMLSDVERRGMKVNQSRLKSMEIEYRKKLNKMGKSLANLAKSAGFSTSRYVDETDAKSEPDELNPKSPKQMAYVFIDIFDLPKYHGERTTKEDALLYWQNLTSNEDSRRKTFINQLLEYRGQHKLYSQYLKGMDKHIENDGRVRSNLNLHGTSTGRLSSSNINSQNIARQSDIRNIFCPPNGWLLAEIDLSQAELRTLAVLSGDEFLLNAYKEDGDLHDTMAAKIFNEDFTYEQRQVAKTVNFGIVYDQSAEALSESLEIPVPRAKDYINTFFNNALQAGQWLEERSKEPFEEGITPTSYFGRKMRFTLLTKHKIGNIKRTARNFPIQSAASDLHLLSGVKVWKHIRNRDDAYIVNLVHDSMLLEIKEEAFIEIVKFAQNTMEKTSREALNSSIPFKADVEASDYGWGSLKEKKDSESWNNFLKRIKQG